MWTRPRGGLAPRAGMGTTARWFRIGGYTASGSARDWAGWARRSSPGLKTVVVAVAEQTALALADTPVGVTMLCPALVRSAMSPTGVDPADVADEALHAVHGGRFAVVQSQCHRPQRRDARFVDSGRPRIPPSRQQSRVVIALDGSRTRRPRSSPARTPASAAPSHLPVLGDDGCQDDHLVIMPFRISGGGHAIAQAESGLNAGHKRVRTRSSTGCQVCSAGRSS